MKLLLAIVSISVFLIGDCRRVHVGGERADSVGKDQPVTSPVNVIEENLSTMTINNILEEVINQESDAASPDDDEDGYAGDHDSSSAASIFYSKNATVKPPQIRKKGKSGPSKLSKRMNRILGAPAPVSYTGLCPGTGLFELIEGTCYFFSIDQDIKLNQPLSINYCENLGRMFGVGGLALKIHLADLGDLHSASSHNLFLQKITEKLVAKGETGVQVYLGAKKVGSTWKWQTSGCTLSTMNPYWSPIGGNGQPDGDGPCLAAWIYPNNFMRSYFNDLPCSDEMYFACQLF